MKKISLNSYSLTLIAFLVASILFTSCNKDEADDAPDYVGNWTMSETTNGFTIKNDLNCTETSFDLTGSSYLKMYEVIGGLSVSGSEMSITPTKIGVLNSETMTFSYYESGVDDEFDNLISYSPIGAGGKGQYSVVNNKLTLKFDTDSNGKIDELDNALVFIRK